jgi:transposase
MTALQTPTTPAFHPGPMADRPDPEVPERARRRTFTARYKLAVLTEYDAAEAGAKGAILRREGLYSSHLVDWRHQRGHRLDPAQCARPRGHECGSGPARRSRTNRGRVPGPGSAAQDPTPG